MWRQKKEQKTREVVISLWIVIAVMVMTSCGETKKAKGGGEKYKRIAITERNEEDIQKESMMIAAKMSGELGDSKAAMAQYRQILARDNQYAAALYEMSQLYAEEEQVDSALVYAKRAVESGKDNVWYKLHLAVMYRYNREQGNAIKTWESIVKENPNVLEYYYELSNAYLANEEAEKAIATLNRVEQRVGISEEVSKQKALIWKNIGKMANARKELETLSETLPGDNRYNAILAEEYMRAGNYDKAKKYYDKILQNDPNDEYVHFSLAEYYKKRGDATACYQELKRGFENKNSLTTANKMQIMSSIYSDAEIYTNPSKEMLELLSLVLVNNDDSVGFSVLYGETLRQQRRYQDAANQYEIYLSRDSSKYEIWERLLMCESITADQLWSSRNKDSIAEFQRVRKSLLSHARRAQAIFPLHLLPYYLQGMDAYREAQYGEAIEFFKQCESLGIENDKMEDDIYLLLAESYHSLNKDSESFAYYEKYTQHHPEDYTTLNNYAYYLATRGKEIEKAYDLAKRALSGAPDNPYCLDTYAWILHLMGRNEEARPYILKALKNNKNASDEVREHYRVIMGKNRNE